MTRACLLFASLACAGFITTMAASAGADQTDWPVRWASVTSTAAESEAHDVRDAALLQACGIGDSSLHAVAAELAVRAAWHRPAPTTRELGQRLRAQGVAYSGARAWTAAATQLEAATINQRAQRWISSLDTSGLRRCGIGRVTDSEHGEAVALVVVDTIARLRRPIPVQVRLGSWITVEADVLVPADATKVVVLGPRGRPRTIPTSFDPARGHTLGRFMADRTGRWRVQVLVTTESGPRPALEADVFAGAAPPSSLHDDPAPGEAAASGARGDHESVDRMLQAARVSEGVEPLERDVELDVVAASHARAMMRAGKLAHDVGNGGPQQRLAAAGLQGTETGENVARAPNVVLAHRTLWASPSHRTNMLHGRFQRVGIGVERDARGQVWVALVFAR